MQNKEEAYASSFMQMKKYLQRSVNGTPTQAKLATLSVLPLQLKLRQKGTKTAAFECFALMR